MFGSNASLLSILSIQNKKSDKVLLAVLKPVEDIAPAKIYWYQKHGKDGDAKPLLKSHSKLNRVRQWVAVGRDEEMRQMWEVLVESHSLDLQFGGEKITLEFPSAITNAEFDDGSNIHKVGGIQPLSSAYLKNYFSVENWDKSFYPESEALKEISNCNNLEMGIDVTGGETGENIQIFPYGLFEQGELHRLFLSKIVAIYQERGINSRLRGVIDKKRSEEPQEYKGFVALSVEDRSKFGIRISDFDRNVLGENQIDPATGLWKVLLSRPSGEGIISIFDTESKQDVFAEKFWLIKKIEVITHVVSRTLSDFYGRTINFTEPAVIDQSYSTFRMVWNKDLYENERTAQLQLCDQITPFLEYLGPKILVSDPYGIGNVEIVAGKAKLTPGQQIFLNSLFIGSFHQRITELSILMSWKVFHDRDKAKSQEEYVKNLKLLFKQNKDIGIQKVSILFSDKPFHNRHWSAQRAENEFEIFRVTNSISGMFSSDDFEIISVASLEQPRLNWQIRGRIEPSEKVIIL